MKSDVRTKLENIVTQHLKRQPTEFAIGKLDSLAVIRLIVQLESVFGLSIVMTDINDQNFGSFASMETFVAGKVNLPA